MANSMERGFSPEMEQDPVEMAKTRWGVDLNDDEAVLAKLRELQTNTMEVSALSNLWQDYKNSKDANVLDQAA